MGDKIIYWQDKQAINLLTKSLHKENISIGTSDTVLGFLAPLKHAGFKKLNDIKGRENKPYIVLADSIEKLPLFIDPIKNSNLLKLIKSCWPGPLTVIFNAKESLPKYLKSPEGKIALRIPNHKGLLELLANFDGLFSTSANLSGQPIPKKVEDIDERIIKEVDYIVLDELQRNETIPSTIIECTDDKITVLREGAYSISELEKIYGQPILLNK